MVLTLVLYSKNASLSYLEYLSQTDLARRGGGGDCRCASFFMTEQCSSLGELLQLDSTVGLAFDCRFTPHSLAPPSGQPGVAFQLPHSFLTEVSQLFDDKTKHRSLSQCESQEKCQYTQFLTFRVMLSLLLSSASLLYF